MKKHIKTNKSLSFFKINETDKYKKLFKVREKGLPLFFNVIINNVSGVNLGSELIGLSFSNNNCMVIRERNKLPIEIKVMKDENNWLSVYINSDYEQASLYYNIESSVDKKYILIENSSTKEEILNDSLSIEKETYYYKTSNVIKILDEVVTNYTIDYRNVLNVNTINNEVYGNLTINNVDNYEGTSTVLANLPSPITSSDFISVKFIGFYSSENADYKPCEIELKRNGELTARIFEDVKPSKVTFKFDLSYTISDNNLIKLIK